MTKRLLEKGLADGRDEIYVSVEKLRLERAGRGSHQVLAGRVGTTLFVGHVGHRNGKSLGKNGVAGERW